MKLEDNSEYYAKVIEAADYSDTEFSGIEFESCTFVGCNFSNAVFRKCNFVDCEFSNCNLSVVSIVYSKFSEVSFIDSKVIGIDWTKVAWPRLLISAPVRFYKSILNDCSFYGLALQEVVIEECKAHDVDFREGRFINANFAYTDLTGSYFNNTDLSGADFSEASNYDIDIYTNKIKGAKFSRFEAVRLLNSLDIELID